MSCIYKAATNPWVANEIGMKCNEAYAFLGKERMRPESGREMCIWNDTLNLPLHFKISHVTIAVISNL